MTAEPASAQRTSQTRSGWIDAVLFAFALSALNVSYGLGNQWGVRPVTMLVWAMPSAAIALLLAGGIGSDWARVMRHPLSLIVGTGIIAMEAVYYLLLTYTTPTDGSILVRLGVPISMLLGIALRGRLPSLISALGGLIIAGTVLWYVPQMITKAPLLSLALGAGCGAIMSTRSFAAEFHPWNRAANTIKEKMRITGLMLLTASLIGLIAVATLHWATSNGHIAHLAWLPDFAELTAPEGIIIGLTVGIAVLTAMQYLGFSTVVKLGTEVFIATTALIPLATLAVQEAVIATGLLRPIPVDWRVAPAMAGVIFGVALVIAGQHKR